MKNKVKRFIAILIIIIGIGFLIYPYFVNRITSKKIEDSISVFLDEIGDLDEIDNIETVSYQDKSKEDNSKNSYAVKNDVVSSETRDYLYTKMKEYNRTLNEKEQTIVDAFSYETPSFDLTKYGLEENIIGIITIPKINLELPIYLGATEENLNKGAVHLSQTSLPLGGNNSNTVIAAHRSSFKHEFFKNIDKLEIGDEVIIKAFWKTLTYTVSEKCVISPYDSSKVLIQKDKDLVTLITCHPYGETSERYVVYCERKNNVKY